LRGSAAFAAFEQQVLVQVLARPGRREQGDKLLPI
jgi:hypothetical protein